MCCLRPSMLFLLAANLLLTGCGRREVSETPAAETHSEYRLSAEPQGARDVAPVVADAGDQEQVAVVGRIGGETDPWVADLAAFNLVDLSLKPCNAIEGDNCPQPWDYCCEPNLARARILVQVVDAQGQVVPNDAQKLLGVKELDTVVARGTVRRDEAGNATLLARGIYVRSE